MVAVMVENGGYNVDLRSPKLSSVDYEVDPHLLLHSIEQRPPLTEHRNPHCYGVHPQTRRKNSWNTMEQQRIAGRTRSSGHSTAGSRSPQSPLYDSPTSPTSPKGSRTGDKLCLVCGDVAKSNHFGGLSCDSCKAFFRRSVQNNAFKAFTCPYEKKCVIAKMSRKTCQFCRFEKCLSIGMEKSWVMSEDERKKLMEQRQERKTTQQPAIRKDLNKMAPLPTAEHNYELSAEMEAEIKEIEANYEISNSKNPYGEESATNESAGKIFNVWMTFCKKIGFFFHTFPDFGSLKEEDKSILLRTAMTSASIIMGAVTKDMWGRKGTVPAIGMAKMPKVSSEGMKTLVPSDLLSKVSEFFMKFRNICPDTTMAKILILVTLYSSELTGLEETDKIQQLQDHYINILDCYIKHRYRENSGHRFAKALVSLADVRELSDQSFNMRFQNAENMDLAKVNSDSSNGGSSGNNDMARREYGGSGGSSSHSSYGGSGSSSNLGGGGSGGQYGCSNTEHLKRNESKETNIDYFKKNRSSGEGYSSLKPGTKLEDFNSSDDMCNLDSNKRNSHHKLSASARERVDRRIQTILKSIPTPAVMKIICHIADSLNFEAEKTPDGLKLSVKEENSPRKNPPIKLKMRRTSTRKTSTSKSSKSCKPRSSYSDYSAVIKQEQTDIENKDYEAIDMIVDDMNASSLSNGEEMSYSAPRRNAFDVDRLHRYESENHSLAANDIAVQSAGHPYSYFSTRQSKRKENTGQMMQQNIVTSSQFGEAHSPVVNYSSHLLSGGEYSIENASSHMHSSSSPHAYSTPQYVFSNNGDMVPTPVTPPTFGGEVMIPHPSPTVSSSPSPGYFQSQSCTSPIQSDMLLSAHSPESPNSTMTSVSPHDLGLDLYSTDSPPCYDKYHGNCVTMPASNAYFNHTQNSPQSTMQTISSTTSPSPAPTDFSYSLNLSSLTDVEMNALQDLVEHINVNLTNQLRDGNSYNTEDLLSKEFLSTVQANLTSEH